MAQQRSALAQAAVPQEDDDPQQAARAIELGNAMGVRPDAIYPDVENAEQQHRAALTRQILQGNPVLFDYANSHPLASVVSKDDWGNLDAASEALKKLTGDQADNYTRGRLNPIVQRIQETPIPQRPSPEELMKKWGGTEDILHSVATQTNPLNYGWHYISGIADALNEAAQSATSAALDEKRSGVERALAGAAAIPQAATAAGFAAMQPLNDVIKAVGDSLEIGTRGQIWSEDVQRALMLPGILGLGEKAAGLHEAKVMQQAVDSSALLRDYAKQGKLPPYGSDPFIDQAHEQVAKDDVKNLDDALQAMTKTQTRELSPELAETFAKLHADTNIHVSAEAIQKLYGDKFPEPDDKLLGWVPDLTNKVLHASQFGGDVEIPLASWLAKVEPDVAKELHDFIRVRKGQPTLDEIAQGKERPEATSKAEESKLDEDKFVIKDPLGATEDNQEMQVTILRDETGAPEAFYTDELGVTKIAAGYKDLPIEEAIAHTFGDHPQEEAPDVSKVRRLNAKNEIAQGKERAEISPSASDEPKPKLEEGEKAITAALEKWSSSPRGQGNGWIQTPEGGQGIYARLFQQTVQLANLDFEEKGTGAFTRYLDHIESEVKRLGLSGVHVENILNPRLEQFLRQRGYVDAPGSMKETPSLEKMGADLYKPREDPALNSIRNLAGVRETAFGNPEGWDSVEPGPKEEGIKFIDSSTKYKGDKQLYGKYQILHEFPLRDAMAKADIGSLSSDTPEGLSLGLFERKILEHAGNVPVRVISDADLAKEFAGRPEAGDPSRLAFYQDGFHHIVISQSAAEGKVNPVWASHMVFHEGSHAVTVKAINNFPELAADIQELSDRVKEKLSPKELKQHSYAFKNIKEFIAQAWSEPQFRQLLSTIQLSKDLIKRFELDKEDPTSAWDLMIKIIRKGWEKLVGEAPSPTALDAVMRFADQTELGIKAYPQLMKTHWGPEEPMEGKVKKAATDKAPQERPPEFRDPRAMGLTVKQFNKLQELWEKRKAEDANRQLKKGEALERERQTAEWQKARAETHVEVQDDLRSRPDIASARFLREGHIYGEKVRRVRLGKDFLTPEQRQGLHEDFVGDKGVHPDAVAGLFGYPTGNDMVEGLKRLEADRQLEGLTPAQHFSKLVEAETDRRMRAEHGNLEQNILEEAKDHVLGQTTLDLLHEETVAMAEQKGEKFDFTKEAVKKAQEEKFNSVPISAHDSDSYLQAAGRAGRKAEDALLEGKPADAFKAKQEQYHAMLQAQMALKLEKEIARNDKLVKRFTKRVVAGVKPEYTNWIHDIMMRTGQMARPVRSLQDLQEAIARERSSTFEEFVGEKARMGYPILPPGFLFDEGFRKDIRQMTPDDFRGVADTLKTLSSFGKSELKFNRAGEEEDLREFITRAVEQMKENENARNVPTQPQRSKIRNLVGIAHQLFHTLINLETTWNRLDRGDKYGLFNTSFSYRFAEAANSFSDLLRKYGEELAALDAVKDKKQVLPELLQKPSSVGITDREMMTMTREHLIAIMRNMGTESNFDKLIRGYFPGAKRDKTGMNPGLYERAQQAIENWVHTHARPEDWKLVQKEGEIYEKIYREAETMIQNVGGVPPPRIPLREVQTKFGTKPGWYHPVIYDRVEEGTSTKLMGKSFDDLDGLDGEGFFKATTAKGWARERTGYAGPIYLGLDRSAIRMTTILRDVAFRPAIIEGAKAFYDPEFRKGILRYAGQDVRDKLDPFLKSLGGVGNSPMSAASWAMENTLEYFRRNLISQLVGWNPHTLMKHTLSAAANSVWEVGFLNISKEMVNILRTGDLHPTLSNWDFAMSKSDELRRRYHNAAGTVSGEYEKLLEGSQTYRDLLYEKGTAPIGFFDLLSAVPTWTAEYKKALADLRERGEENDGLAAQIANRAVRRAHGSSAISSRPEAMRSGAMGRMFTSLYGFFNAALQRNYEAMWRSKAMVKDFKEGEYQRGLSQIPIATKLLIGGVIAPALVEEWATPYTNAEHDSWGEWILKTMVQGASGTIPLIREMVSGIIEGTEPGFGLFGTEAREISNTAHDIAHPSKLMDAQHGGKTVKDANALFGLLTGWSNNFIGNSLKTLWDSSHHTKETPRNLTEVSHELASGHPRKEPR